MRGKLNTIGIADQKRICYAIRTTLLDW